MKPLTNTRLASKAMGDDVSLTRYVRIGRGATHTASRGRSPRLLAEGLAPQYVVDGRTKFPTRVMPVADMTTLLVSGHSNVKIGRDVRKGRLKGYWIYTLSLEERATCPSSCQHWQSCYGNNMPFAKRIIHTDPDFLPRLEAEIADLCAKKPGVLIRLHALGDFYSELYVAFWDRMLGKHRNLSIFGYTARSWYDDPIGQALLYLRIAHAERFMIRTSGGGEEFLSTVNITAVEDCPTDAFVCPEQTGKTRCCATCGACWSTKKNVAFLAH